MWRVYYGDGSIYSGEVADTPARNVQVIAQSSPEHGWSAVAGTDYYIWREDRWVGVDWFGLCDYLIDPGMKKVLFGRTLTKEEFNAVWQRMMADPNLPPKTGYYKKEARPSWVQR